MFVINNNATKISIFLYCELLGFIIINFTKFKFVIRLIRAGIWVWSLPYSACAAITKYHKLRGLKNRNFFFHCSGGQRSKIEVPRGLVSCEMTPLACRRPPSYCTHTAIPLCSCSPSVSSSSSKDTSPFGLEPHLCDLI